MNNQKECQGEKCSAVNDVGHSPECQFEHFLSYTGFWSESAAVRDKLKLAFTDGVAAGQLNGKPVASNQSDELDDDHPLYLVNGQIEDLLEGFGASEDHEDVIKFLLDTGLPRSTVDRIHKAIVWGDTKVRPVNRRDLRSILRAVQDFEISCARAVELIDLAEVEKLRNEDFPGEPKNLFNEDDIPVDLYIEAKGTLQAIVARFQGEWDHPELVKRGGLHTATENDVLSWAEGTLKKMESEYD